MWAEECFQSCCSMSKISHMKHQPPPFIPNPQRHSTQGQYQLSFLFLTVDNNKNRKCNIVSQTKPAHTNVHVCIQSFLALLLTADWPCLLRSSVHEGKQGARRQWTALTKLTHKNGKAKEGSSLREKGKQITKYSQLYPANKVDVWVKWRKNIK